VQVVRVEKVDIGGLPGALARRAERQLAQPPDLLQAPRNLLGPRVLDQVLAALDEALVRGQRLDLALRSDSGIGGATGAW